MTTHERVDSPLRSPAAASAGPAAVVKPARLRLRGLSGWEEEYVERHQSEPNTARTCNEILARCLVPPGADPAGAREIVRGLLVAERDRELVALRRLSLGPDIRAHVDCAACGEVNEVDFSLDVLPLDFEPPPRTLSVELPGVGEVRLRLPTAGDQEDLFDAGLAGAAERRSWLLARCLERYGDRSDGFDVDFARGLPVRVRAELESAMEASLPQIDLEMTLECSHCRGSMTVPFDVPVFFFRTEQPVQGSPARHPPDRARLPLGRARYPRPDARSPAGLPAAARAGRGRRPARRPRRRGAGMTAPPIRHGR